MVPRTTGAVTDILPHSPLSKRCMCRHPVGIAVPWFLLLPSAAASLLGLLLPLPTRQHQQMESPTNTNTVTSMTGFSLHHCRQHRHLHHPMQLSLLLPALLPPPSRAALSSTTSTNTTTIICNCLFHYIHYYHAIPTVIMCAFTYVPLPHMRVNSVITTSAHF